MDETLKAALLAIGGSAVEGPMPDSGDMGKAHAFARGWVVEMGRPVGLCHKNSARLWSDLKGSLSLCTGLALSGGVWRWHSWCVLSGLGEPAIIETATAHDAYYGNFLVEDEATVFFYSHK